MSSRFTRLSQYFMPTLKADNISHQFNSKSAELLTRAGYIRPSSTGIYNLLPLGERVITKISQIIDNEMRAINGIKCTLSLLQPSELWERTGRNEIMNDEIFRIKDSTLMLAPTHEEEVTKLVAESINSYRQLPLRLYQIGPKFRHEARPKGGLLRCREFLMKDLYTFDANEDAAKSTYQEVCEAYKKIFNRLGLAFHQVSASSGAIGGSHSHEFHIECESGQDTLLKCSSCGHIGNAEVFPESKCPECKETSSSSSIRGLEIGHTFLLGDKYSKALDAKFKDQKGKEQFMQMGCYGIGVSRLLAAIVEANHDDNGIIWPSSVAPFDAYIIQMDDNIPHLENNVKDYLIDDRVNMSFSRKLKDAQLCGVPNILVSRKDGIEVLKHCVN